MNDNLTQKLIGWRNCRNITNENTRLYISNVIEELLEVYHTDKELIKKLQEEIMTNYFSFLEPINELNTIDAIQDIQVFSINEVELMGYDNLKCNDEVFKEISSRRQDPKQAMEWSINGRGGKWNKWIEQPKESLYKANYEGCRK